MTMYVTKIRGLNPVDGLAGGAIAGVVQTMVAMIYGLINRRSVWEFHQLLATLVGRPVFFDEQVAALRQGKTITLFEDEWRTPLSLATAARALLALVPADVRGLLHIGGPERLSRLEMGQRLAAYLGVDPARILAASRESMKAAEPRPRDLSLDSSRWRALFPGEPWLSLEESLAAEQL